jgi:hypothetical protein
VAGFGVYAVQRIMIIDGAMGTVIQQYKLQVSARWCHVWRLIGPANRGPRVADSAHLCALFTGGGLPWD